MSTKGSIWPVIDPSRFIHQITWLRQTLTPDASGMGESWKPDRPAVTSWVSIEEMNGTDVIRAGQNITQIPITVEMNYRPGILPNMRFQAADGTQYVVRSVENVNRMNMFLRLNCLGLGANE